MNKRYVVWVKYVDHYEAVALSSWDSETVANRLSALKEKSLNVEVSWVEDRSLVRK